MKQNLIETPIGNEQWSNTKDIKRIREALYRLGYEDQNLEYGYIDKTLDNNIRNFQKQNALKVDGLIFPGGETEKLLISSLKNKISDEKKGIEQEKLPSFSPPQKMLDGLYVQDDSIYEGEMPRRSILEDEALMSIDPGIFIKKER